jgi:hypothetical protein
MKKITFKAYKVANEILGYDVLINGQVKDQIFKRGKQFRYPYNFNGAYFRLLSDAKKDAIKKFTNIR